MDSGKFIYTFSLITLLLDQSGCDWLNCAHILGCRCKWSSGKKTAYCMSAGLMHLPRLASDIQVLDLHGNPLRELDIDAFAAIDLLNIQRLNLSFTKLHRIHKYAFKGLKILIELDLSHNELHQLPYDTFKGIDRLRLLILNNNPLNELYAEQFPPLSYLKKLEISQCQLRKIHPFAFRYLKALETISAHQNLLSFVHLNTFNLPLLKTLTLSENPWYCDCRLRDFHEWFLKANLGNEQVLCAGPGSHTQVPWRRIRQDEMVCPPSVVTSPSVMRAEIGTEITFGCLANGDPKPTVSWYFRQEEIKNFTKENSVINIHRYMIEQFDEYNKKLISKTSQWVNISISNVTERFSGEWKCYAYNSGGETSSYLNLFLPTARTATARAAPEYSVFILVIGSMLGMIGVGFLAACVCWKIRRRLPPSRIFTEQQKKLLESSLAPSCDRHNGDLNSSYDLEMFDRSISLDSVNSERCMETVQITLEHTGIYPPPPVEFALPAPYGNIFISLRLSGSSNEYKDLLGNEVTLPRRSNTCIFKSADNYVGPRVNTASSSTWSLPGNNQIDNQVDNNLVKSFPMSSEFTAL